MDSKTYSVFIDGETHHEVKMIAAEKNLKIKEVVRTLLRKALGIKKLTTDSVMRGDYKPFSK